MQHVTVFIADAWDTLPALGSSAALSVLLITSIWH